MNMMEQIMSEMKSRQMNNSAMMQQQNAEQQGGCGCLAARTKVQRGLVVRVTGRPPETPPQARQAQQARQVRQLGPRGGFIGSTGGTGRSGATQGGTLIKVERKPVNLMDEILAGLRNRR